MFVIKLLDVVGYVVEYVMVGECIWCVLVKLVFNCVVYFVVYVVVDLCKVCDLWVMLVVDWEKMFEYCCYFYLFGFGVVEVMDIV